MELKLTEGKYSIGTEGGFCRVSGAEELAQRIAMKLTARRGAFPMIPEYGSRLYLLGRAKPSELESTARQYIAEALDGEPVQLQEISAKQQEDSLRLELKFDSGEEKLLLAVTI